MGSRELITRMQCPRCSGDDVVEVGALLIECPRCRGRGFVFVKTTTKDIVTHAGALPRAEAIALANRILANFDTGVAANPDTGADRG